MTFDELDELVHKPNPSEKEKILIKEEMEKLERKVFAELGLDLEGEANGDLRPDVSKMNRKRLNEKNPNSKKVRHISSEIVFSTINEASQCFMVSRQTISNHCNKRVKKVEFEFVE